MSSMKAYLAEKYMSGPKADAILARAAPTKKKKSKRTAVQATASSSSASGSKSGGIVDDDAGWGAAIPTQDEDADDIADAVVASDRAFKKRKVDKDSSSGGGASGWTTVAEGAREESPLPAEDEQPQIVDDTGSAPVRGLVTGEEMRKRRLAEEKRKATQRTEMTQEEIAAAQETVYRDASGRKIDTKAERAEAARKKREREEKEAAKMEWGKGLVQREEEQERKRELEKNRGKTFSRRVDDKDLNEDLRSQERWNDPAAAFLTVS
jgi:pre-mRNA-splicing factor CWC26